MNGFLQEVLTQGELLKQTINFYRGEGMQRIDAVRDVFETNGMDPDRNGQLAVCDGLHP